MRSMHLLCVAAAAMLACTGGGDGKRPDPDPVSISGVVVMSDEPIEPMLGAYATVPVKGARVMILGQAGEAVTGDDGSFTLVGEAGPYDLVVIASGDGHDKVVVMRGLTRSDPVIHIPTVPTWFFSPSHSARVSGTMSGTGALAFPLEPPLLAFATAATRTYDRYSPPRADGTFGLYVSWSGPAQTSVRLHGYVRDGATYVGHGSATVDVQDGDDLTGIDLPVAAVASTTVSGSTSSLLELQLSPRILFPGDPRQVRLPVVDLSGSTDFTASFPVVDGADLRLAVVDAHNGPQWVARHLTPGATGLAPTLTSVGYTIDGGDTSYCWFARAGAGMSFGDYGDGVRLLHYGGGLVGGGSAEVHVYEAGSHVPVPDLRSVGVQLAGTGCYSGGLTFAPFASVDELAAPALPDAIWSVW